MKAVDSSLFLNNSDLSFDNDNTLVCLDLDYSEPVEQIQFEDVEDEYKNSSDFEEKKEKSNSDIPASRKRERLTVIVSEYENWEGRIVSIESAFIRARLMNTQRLYSPRMIQIDKNLFVKNGINKVLEIGDMFELTFKNIQEGKYSKRNTFSYQTINVDTIRMVEQVRLTQQEIQQLVDEEFMSLSYLFE